MGNRFALAVVFTLSFLSYMTADLRPSLQLIPLVAFAILVFWQTIWYDNILVLLGSLLDGDGILFAIIVPILVLVTSAASKSDKSLETAILMSVCIVLARIYMTLVSVKEVLESFFWSGVVSMSLLLAAGFS